MNKDWILIDANNKILGKVAVEVAKELMGKNTPEYLPNQVKGKKVVVINSDKVAVTANKMETKLYRHHTGFPGGLKEITLGQQMTKDSTKVIRDAVDGMLPKNKLRKQMLANLYIYKDETQSHLKQEK